MIVIFSGYNQRAVIAFLRTLRKNNLEAFSIIASGQSDSILKTSYQDKVAYIRKIKHLDFPEIKYAVELIARAAGGKPLWIAPSTEAVNRFFLENRAVFESMGCMVPLPDRKVYEQVSDKEKFYGLCMENGIAVPKKRNAEGGFETPVIAKPKKYISSDGGIYAPAFLLTEQEYQDFIGTHRADDFDMLEFLQGGTSFYLLFYFSKKGEVYCSSQKNLVQQPGGKSMIAACCGDFHKKKEIVGPYECLLKKIGFTGLAMVEVRRAGDTYYMIEANPRFWGTSQLFCDMGYNFFEFMLEDHGFLEQARILPVNEDAVYFWSGGIRGRSLETGDCFWHEGGKQAIGDRHMDFQKSDIYRKEDTMEVYDMELLENLYMQAGKHSNYQILPGCLEGVVNKGHIQVKSRQERERISYIKEHIDFEGKSILDIGGNTGYFSFELLGEGVRHVDYYEGNQAHAEYVQTAARVLRQEGRLTVYPEYYLFCERDKKYDVILCLNVIHHIGADFLHTASREDALKEMISDINSLSYCTDMLVFQMGFNWKGDTREGLFPNGTKKEMEQYLYEGVKGYWDILFIGIAQKHGDSIVYEEMDRRNNERQDELGEFLNRPIFIMKSRKQGKEAE